MSESELIRVLRRFILDRLLRDEDPERLTPTTPLVSSGLLDSLATVELLAFLEDHAHVRFEAHEIDWSRMDSMEAIETMVRAKQRS